MCEGPSDELLQPPGATVRPGALKRALVVAGCGVLSVTATACESTEQESAKIASREQAAAASALKLGAIDHQVHVSDATLVSGGGRMAVAVKLTSSATRPLVEVPLLAEVTGAGGKVLYTNATPGLEASLQHVALLRPHQSTWWVDDQVLITKHETGVVLHVGTGSRSHSSSPADVTAAGVHATQQGGSSLVSGKLIRHGGRAHGKLLVSVVALKGGRVVAAGRSVLASSSGGSFTVFLIGSAAGAKLTTSVSAA